MRVRLKEVEFTYPKNAFYFSSIAITETQMLINIEGYCTLPEAEVKISKYILYTVM